MVADNLPYDTGNNPYEEQEACDAMGDELTTIRAQLTEAQAALEAERLHRAERKLLDMRPDDALPVRILSAYIDNTYVSDNTAGEPPQNPLCVAMNEATTKRNEILRNAISSFDNTELRLDAEQKNAERGDDER